MKETCKTPIGKEFDEPHKKNVEDHISLNAHCYKPLNEMPKHADNNNNQPNNKTNENILKKISIKELKLHIMKTPNKAPGDSIYPQHLKIGSQKWKTSLISMILKPNKPASLTTSYRPISLLPILGKLFERILTTRLTEYMTENNLINKFQCGFRKGKSCEHQLIRLAEHVSSWFNKKPSGRTVAIFIDAEKAFDSVKHSFLWQALLEQGVDPRYVAVLSNLYTGQRGHIVGGATSRPFKLSLIHI